MKAGRTDIEIGTRIRTTSRWDKSIITGEITHPFGCFGITKSTVAGIYIDPEYKNEFGKIGNLYDGDYEVIKE